MLIYNYNHEFIGIDENDLKVFGYKNLADLQKECSDFADLFVEKPSYIHKFKNFNWIYYILNANPGEAKVLIKANGKNFTASLELNTLYLSDAPDSPAYAITLDKIRNLDAKESDEIYVAPIPQNTTIKNKQIQTADSKIVIALQPEAINKTIKEKTFIDHGSNDDLLKQEEKLHKEVLDLKIPVATSNIVQKNPKALKVKTKLVPEIQKEEDSAYTYDPQVASDELGLPLDLIEEFIGDFILQAYDFKEQLYSSVANHDFNEIKLLSHKLKGVAANLRIEDALEKLTAINISEDFLEIQMDLNRFYNIIAKLEGNEKSDQIVETLDPIETQKESIRDLNDDIYSFNIKDDNVKLVENPVKDFDTKEDLYHLKDDTLTNETTKITVPPVSHVKLEFNKKTVIHELGLAENIVDELIDDFKVQSQKTYKKMQSSYQSNAFIDLRRTVIDIKGVADNLRFTQIASVLEELYNTKDRKLIQKLILDFKTYIDQI